MAIYFETNNPTELLATFKKKIVEKNIVTWSYDSEGDFTHTTPQWNRKAWLRPEVTSGRLALYILGPKGQNITTEIYAIYHGRFIESMLAHCDSLFSEANATAIATIRDSISG